MRVETGDHFRFVMESALQTRMSDNTKYICYAEGMSWVLVSVSDFNGINCEISVCSQGPKPPLLTAIRRSLHYVFHELKCQRVTSLIYDELKHSQRLSRICGFKKEGVLRKAGVEGQDVIIMGLLKDELPARLVWQPELKKAA